MAGLTGMLGYASPVSCFMSHRTTNGDFRFSDQRAKLTFFRREEARCFFKG